MPRQLLIGLGCGLMSGILLAFAAQPRIATAQATPPTAGLYQIQIGTGLQQQGTSAIWRLNTATGALEFCTFSNVALSGANHISCQGTSGPR
jgi:hypothetical protein